MQENTAGSKLWEGSNNLNFFRKLNTWNLLITLISNYFIINNTLIFVFLFSNNKIFYTKHTNPVAVI